MYPGRMELVVLFMEEWQRMKSLQLQKDLLKWVEAVCINSFQGYILQQRVSMYRCMKSNKPMYIKNALLG